MGPDPNPSNVRQLIMNLSWPLMSKARAKQKPLKTNRLAVPGAAIFAHG